MANDRFRVAIGTVYPYDEERVQGGVEAVALYLTRALAKVPDIDLHVVSCTRRATRSYVEKRGNSTFYWIATPQRLHALRAATIDAWRVSRVYYRIQPDIIHAQGCSEYALDRHNDLIPLLLTVHGLEVFSNFIKHDKHFRGVLGSYRKCAVEHITRESIARCQAAISIAGEYLGEVAGHLLRDRTIYNIGNPVADSFFQVSPIPVNDSDVVLFVGKVTERKDLVTLIRAFIEIAVKRESIDLHIAGPIIERGYYQRLQKEIPDRYRNRIVFLGHLNESQLVQQYQRATILAVSSFQETAPMAIAQGMAAGLAIVSTRVGGVPWMIDDGYTGYTVDVGDAPAMSERMYELLVDRARRREFGLAAKKKAYQLFSAARVAGATMHAYREVRSNRLNA